MAKVKEVVIPNRKDRIRRGGKVLKKISDTLSKYIFSVPFKFVFLLLPLRHLGQLWPKKTCTNFYKKNLNGTDNTNARETKCDKENETKQKREEENKIHQPSNFQPFKYIRSFDSPPSAAITNKARKAGEEPTNRQHYKLSK